jgi:acyl-coenzyme A synthetase/AMP-(fatty) acid ligase
MGVLDYDKLHENVKTLLQQMDKWQWEERTINKELITFDKVLTREDLRNLPMEPLVYSTKTSGSTGEPVTVQKTYQDLVWYYATNIREFIWRNWDVFVGSNKVVLGLGFVIKHMDPYYKK